jgi:OFA family oxalate/formate antiporter-like MFS transporter
VQHEASARYYGWTIVALSFVVLTASYSLLYGYSVFVPFLAKDLALSRAAVSAPFSICIVVYSLMSLVSGRLTDRLGPRPIILAAGLLMAVGFATLGLTRAAWALYVGLSLIYGLGMTGAYIPTSATLVRWFVAKRGLAVGLANVGGSLALLTGPTTAALLIETFGWRTALFASGLIGGGLVSLAALGFRRDPGEEVRMAAAIRDDAAISWTLPDARRTAAFWIFCTIFLMSWAVMFFPFAHFIALAVDLGWGTQGGVTFFAFAGTGGVFGRLGIGWLSDRTGRKGGLVGFLTAQCISCLLFASFSDAMVLYAAAILFGIGTGASISLYPAVIADLFGRAHVGAIAGFAFAFTCSGGALGPVIGGWLRDRTGSYDAAFIVAAIVNLIAITFAFALRRPRNAR